MTTPKASTQSPATPSVQSRFKEVSSRAAPHSSSSPQEGDEQLTARSAADHATTNRTITLKARGRTFTASTSTLKNLGFFEDILLVDPRDEYEVDRDPEILKTLLDVVSPGQGIPPNLSMDKVRRLKREAAFFGRPDISLRLNAYSLFQQAWQKKTTEAADASSAYQKYAQKLASLGLHDLAFRKYQKADRMEDAKDKNKQLAHLTQAARRATPGTPIPRALVSSIISAVFDSSGFYSETGAEVRKVTPQRIDAVKTLVENAASLQLEKEERDKFKRLLVANSVSFIRGAHEYHADRVRLLREDAESLITGQKTVTDFLREMIKIGLRFRSEDIHAAMSDMTKACLVAVLEGL